MAQAFAAKTALLLQSSTVGLKNKSWETDVKFFLQMKKMGEDVTPCADINHRHHCDARQLLNDLAQKQCDNLPEAFFFKPASAHFLPVSHCSVTPTTKHTKHCHCNPAMFIKDVAKLILKKQVTEALKLCTNWSWIIDFKEEECKDALIEFFCVINNLKLIPDRLDAQAVCGQGR